MSLLTVDVGGANETVIQFIRAGNAERRKIGGRRYAFAGNERSMIRAEKIVLPVQLIAIPAADAATIRSLFALGAIVDCEGDVFNNGNVTIGCMGEITDEMEVGGVYWNLSLTLREVSGASTSVAEDAGGSQVLVNWYDAQGTNYTALGLTDGATLLTWPDESGNAFDAGSGNVSFTGAHAATAINGFPAVYFEPKGNNQRGYDFPNLYQPTAAEAFIVLRCGVAVSPATEGGGAFWAFGASVNDAPAPAVSGQTFLDDFASTSSHSFTFTGDTGTPFLYHVRSRAGQWRAWINGTLVYSTAINAMPWPPFPSGTKHLGIWLNGGVFYDRQYCGWIGEAKFYDGFFSPAAAATMESDMMTKWGITP